VKFGLDAAERTGIGTRFETRWLVDRVLTDTIAPGFTAVFPNFEPWRISSSNPVGIGAGASGFRRRECYVSVETRRAAYVSRTGSCRANTVFFEAGLVFEAWLVFEAGRPEAAPIGPTTRAGSSRTATAETALLSTA
jgi:hypothetical protein